jgi:hypothetical protein
VAQEILFAVVIECVDWGEKRRVTARAALIYPTPKRKTDGVELCRDARLPFP